MLPKYTIKECKGYGLFKGTESRWTANKISNVIMILSCLSIHCISKINHLTF